MNPLTINIRNFRRLDRADLAVAPIALIAGLNGAGKTSTVQAVQAAVLRQPLTTPEALVKTAKELVHRGTDHATATVSFRDADAYVTVTWPACKLDISDDVAPRASEIAAGITSIMEIPAAKRGVALAPYVKADPGEDEIRTAVAELGYSGESVEKIVAAIGTDGWDATHAKAKEAGASFKGAWATTTGATWGDKKSATWTPDGWTEGDLKDADHQQLQMDEVDAQTALERLIASGAVGAAEVERLRDQMNAGLGMDLEAKQAAIDEIQGRLNKLREERSALPSTHGDAGMPCPKCGTHLVVHRSHTDPTEAELREADTEVSPADLKARRMKGAELDGTIARTETDLRAAVASLRNAEQVVENSKTAEAKLAEIGDGNDEDAIAKAREAVAAAQARRLGYEAWVKASKIFTNWSRNDALLAVLATDGLRKRVLVRQLEGLNTRLAEVSAAAKWPAVRIDENFGAWLGAEPYWLLSESMQYRVRVTLQVALAQIDGSDLVIIDRADVLDQKGRNGLMMMLKKVGMQALVAMTVSSRDKVPDLAAAGLGRSYWLEDGKATPIAAAAQEAA